MCSRLIVLALEVEFVVVFELYEEEVLGLGV